MLVMPELTRTEDHVTAEVHKVVRFLEVRFEENASKYRDSFARDLNDAAAVEIAEVLYSADTVKRAKSIIRAKPSSARPTRTEFTF